jgi:hypothetical protein
VLTEGPLLLLRIPEILSFGREIGSKVGGHPGWRSDIIHHRLSRPLDLGKDLDCRGSVSNQRDSFSGPVKGRVPIYALVSTARLPA